jgi:hypothetical protein
MQNPFIAVCVFIIILFFYIHVTSQWKTSDDVEIYEADFESPAQLQEICSVKQPVLFKFARNQLAAPFFEKFQAAQFEKYDNIDIRIKSREDYDAKPSSTSGDDAVDFVPVSFRSARRLMITDTNAKYFSECNHAFLEESGLDRLSAIFDPMLKPPLSAYSKYDILLGSPLVTTPLRHHLESHRFLAVTRGKISVKMCPPKYGKILPQIRDYENYEFRATVNPSRNSKDQQDQKEILNKIKFIDVEVNSGDVLFVPPYWWYSVSFSGDPQTTVASFTYDVAMNILAQSKHWGLYYLQQSNIKTRPAKTIASESPVAKSEEDAPANQDDASRSKDQITRKEEFTHTSSGQKRPEIVTNAGIYVVDALPNE